jgi:hypothetical protein
MKDFRGASYKFYLFLSYYSGIATLFSYSMLIVFGINSGFLNALKLYGISLALGLFISFFVVRICAIILFDEVIPMAMISFFIVPIIGCRLLYLLVVM